MLNLINQKAFFHLMVRNVCLLNTNKRKHMWVCTWLQRVLNVKHRGSVPIQHAFLHFIFSHIRAAIFDSDPSLQVVKMPTIQLKELDQQHAQVWIWTYHFLSVVQLENKKVIILTYKVHFNVQKWICSVHVYLKARVGSMACVTCKKLTAMRNKLYDPIPPVKTSFSSLCSKNCFKTNTKYGNTGYCWKQTKTQIRQNMHLFKELSCPW